jgi:hypothetical protein
MAYMDARRRKNGRTAYVVRWVDAETKESQYQKFDNVEDARFLLAILKAHQSDTAAALKSARDHYGGVYTVTQMIEDHIALLKPHRGAIRSASTRATSETTSTGLWGPWTHPKSNTVTSSDGSG